MWATVAAGFLLIAICVGCFLAFYGFVHLGWTVLSNQTCIITSLLLFGLFASRVITATVKINIDQHKVSEIDKQISPSVDLLVIQSVTTKKVFINRQMSRCVRIRG